MSLLAYSGPRPESEALPLEWWQIGERTITYRATKGGRVKPRRTRLLPQAFRATVRVFAEGRFLVGLGRDRLHDDRRAQRHGDACDTLEHTPSAAGSARSTDPGTTACP